MDLRPTLVATCSAGLGNRLLVLAGSLRLARHFNREFMLYWPDNDHLGCPFADLYENEFELLGEDRLHWLLRTERNVKLYNPRAGCGPQFDQISDDGDPEVHAVVVKAWYAPKLAGEQYDGPFHAAIREELRALRPRSAFLRETDALGLPARCLGVHMRRLADWAEGAEAFGSSRDEHFIAILEGVLERVPDTTFFLAADNEQSEHLLRNRFGDRVLIQVKTSRNRDRRGIEEALMDLLLLSRTAGMVGNHFSSFSTVASLLGPGLAFTANEENAVIRRDETVRHLSAAVAAFRPGAVRPSATPGGSS